MDSESAAAALPPGHAGRRPIGEFLVERGLVTPDELEAALAQQRLSGQRLGEILVERGLISRMALASVLGEQWEEAGRHLRAVVPVRLADGKEADTGLAGGEELTESLAALQTAVARLEDLAGEAGAERPAPSSDGGGASVAADVLVRLERLESWLREEALGDKLVEAFEGFSREIGEVRAVLAEPVAADDALLERLGRIEDALETRPTSEVEERLAALDEWLRGRDDDALGEQVTAALAQLRERFDAVEAAVEAPGERFDRLEALLQERAEAAPDPGFAAAVEELGGKLEKVAGLRSELEELRAAVDREPARDEELHGRLERIEESLAGRSDQPLAAAIGEVRALLELRPVGDPAVSEAIAALQGRLDELAEVRAELGELRSAVGREPARDDELHGRLERIEESLAGRSDQPLAAAIGEVRALLELRPVGDPAVSEAIGALQGRLDELAEVRAELGELRGAVGREPARDDELHERLGRIEESLAGGSDEPFVALHGRLDELAEVRAELADLRGVVGGEPAREGELHARLGRIEESLAARSDEPLATAIEEVRSLIDSRPVTDPGVTDAIVGLRRRLDELAEVRTELGELRGVVGREPVRDEELHARLERIEASLADRTDDSSAGDELVARALAELHSAVDRAGAPDAELHERLGRIESRIDGGYDERTAARLTELREALERAVADDGGLETTLALSTLSDRLLELRAAVERPDASLGELRERLERIEAALTAPRDDGVDGRLHGIAATLDELRDLARRPAEPDQEFRARLERIETLAAAHASREPGEELDRIISAVRDELQELAARNGDAAHAPAAPDAGDIAWHVSAALGSRLEGIEGAVRDALAAPGGPDADDVATRVTAALAAGNDTLAERLDRLGAELGELRNAVPAPLDPAEVAGRVHDVLADRLDGIAAAAGARPEADLVAELAGRLDEIRAALDTDRNAELAEQLGRIESELRSGLAPVGAAVGGHAQQLESLSGTLVRLDGEVLGRLEQLVERLGGLETAVGAGSHEGAVAGLEARIDDLRARLDEPRDGDMRAQLDRLESAVGELPASAREAAEVQGAALGELRDHLGRIDAALADRVETPPAPATYAEPIQVPDPSPEPEPEGPTSFVALVPSSEGYRLVDVTGLLPGRGGTLEVEGATRVVARLGRSPLPGDRRRCAFLEAV